MAEMRSSSVDYLFRRLNNPWRLLSQVILSFTAIFVLFLGGAGGVSCSVGEGDGEGEGEGEVGSLAQR